MLLIFKGSSQSLEVQLLSEDQQGPYVNAYWKSVHFDHVNPPSDEECRSMLC
jgi:hypothetical protein